MRDSQNLLARDRTLAEAPAQTRGYALVGSAGHCSSTRTSAATN